MISAATPRHAAPHVHGQCHVTARNDTHAGGEGGGGGADHSSRATALTRTRGGAGRAGVRLRPWGRCMAGGTPTRFRGRRRDATHMHAHAAARVLVPPRARGAERWSPPERISSE
jgi:hypothetical protein